jgi:integrase
MGVCDTTAHGFRSSFKTWALEATGFQWEVIEAALHHAVGNKVQAAYVRGDNFDKRVTLMDAWAIFCTVAPSALDDVQPMRSVA